MRTSRVLKCQRRRINRVMGVRVAGVISRTAATGEIRKVVNAHHHATFPTQEILLRRRALNNQQLHQRLNLEQKHVLRIDHRVQIRLASIHRDPSDR